MEWSESGGVRYVAGSHRWPTWFRAQSFDGSSKYSVESMPPAPDPDASDEHRIVCFDIEPGDVVAHHVMTLHGARGNATSADRGVEFVVEGRDHRMHRSQVEAELGLQAPPVGERHRTAAHLQPARCSGPEQHEILLHQPSGRLDRMGCRGQIDRVLNPDDVHQPTVAPIQRRKALRQEGDEFIEDFSGQRRRVVERGDYNVAIGVHRDAFSATSAANESLISIQSCRSSGKTPIR